MSNSIYKELLTNNPEYYAGEVNNCESETVPNQAITAKEAVERALRNLPVPARSTPQEAPYDGMEDDVDLDQVSSMPHFNDEMDVADFYSNLSDKVGKVKKNASQTKAEPAPSPSSQEPVTPSSPAQ